jgi:hypothetical protein
MLENAANEALEARLALLLATAPAAAQPAQLSIRLTAASSVRVYTGCQRAGPQAASWRKTTACFEMLAKNRVEQKTKMAVSAFPHPSDETRTTFTEVVASWIEKKNRWKQLP